MKAKELAEIIKINSNTIKRWIIKGKLKATKHRPEPGIGGHDYWDISEEDWNNYLEKLNKNE